MGFLDKMRVQAVAKRGADAAADASSAAPPPPPGAATDPVCHMKVDPARAAGQSEHAGTTYWFCSAGCKTKFDADPQKYLTSSGPHSM